MAKIKKSSKKSENQKFSDLMEDSLGQLRIAVRATAITLVLGIILALGIPKIRAAFFASVPKRIVQQEYSYFSSGGRTEIRFGFAEPAEDQEIADLQQRGWLLAKRFTRGNFTMLALPRLRNQKFFQVLTENSDQILIRFAKIPQNGSKHVFFLILEVKKNVRNSKIIKQALLDYGNYLEKNWIWSFES